MGAFIKRQGRGRTPAMQQTFRNEYQFLGSELKNKAEASLEHWDTGPQTTVRWTKIKAECQEYVSELKTK